MNQFQIKDLEGSINIVSVKLSKYENNGRTRIDLIDDEGFPYATCTINIPNVLLQPDEVLIKDYSENEGILEFLTTNNIVEETEVGVYSGFTFVPVCKLLPESVWGNQKEIVSTDTPLEKKLFNIKDYKIWAQTEEEAQKIVTFIEKI